MSSFYRSNNGIAFEVDIAQRLQALGWDTTDTPRTGDYGADVFARCGSESLVVQCKDWTGPAGFSAVKEVHAARTYYGANQAIVVSRSGYTRQALKAAQTFNINLYTPYDLKVGSAIDRSVQGAQYREELRQAEARYNDEVRQGEALYLNKIRQATEKAKIKKQERILLIGIFLASLIIVHAFNLSFYFSLEISFFLLILINLIFYYKEKFLLNAKKGSNTLYKMFHFVVSAWKTAGLRELPGL